MDILALWLPILITTAVLFFASFLAWAILPHHKPDWNKLPDEDAFFAHLKQANITPGRQYLFPLVDAKDMKDPAMVQRYNDGPWGILNLWPAKPQMGRNMVLTVLFFLIVTAAIAYLASLALPRGTDSARVFQFVAIAALLAHAAGGVCKEIWFSIPLRAKLTDLADAIAYALITALIFALLWPGA